MPTSPALPLPNPAASSTHDVTHDHLLLGARVTGRLGQCRSPTTSNTTHAHRPRATRRATTRAQHATHRPWTATAPNTGGGAALSGRTAGRGRGRRAMPAATSTTERHDQPAMAASWPLSRRPPVTIARPAATRQRSPRPSRPGVQRGGFLAVATIRARGDLHKISAGERLETVTVHLCILRNAACATPPGP